jgi:hypothetical protein
MNKVSYTLCIIRLRILSLSLGRRVLDSCNFLTSSAVCMCMPDCSGRSTSTVFSGMSKIATYVYCISLEQKLVMCRICFSSCRCTNEMISLPPCSLTYCTYFQGRSHTLRSLLHPSTGQQGNLSTDHSLGCYIQTYINNLKAQLLLHESQSVQNTVVLVRLLQDRKYHWHIGCTCYACHAHSQADRCTSHQQELSRPLTRTCIPPD